MIALDIPDIWLLDNNIMDVDEWLIKNATSTKYRIMQYPYHRTCHTVEIEDAEIATMFRLRFGI